jgi:hypothetical protein
MRVNPGFGESSELVVFDCSGLGNGGTNISSGPLFLKYNMHPSVMSAAN